MVKLEGIYKRDKKIGHEVLLNEKGLEVFMGNGKKEKFFDGIDEEIDFSLFLHHIRWVRKNRLPGYSFINIKPSTLVRYKKEIPYAVKGRIVIEIREDHIDSGDIGQIIELRENFPFLLSIDDFGRGSSNLDRIVKLRPNFIKLDMSLFDGLKDLVRFTHFLSNYSSDSILIAEKVENEDLYRISNGAGIPLWQGWYEKKLLKK